MPAVRCGAPPRASRLLAVEPDGARPVTCRSDLQRSWNPAICLVLLTTPRSQGPLESRRAVILVDRKKAVVELLCSIRLRRWTAWRGPMARPSQKRLKAGEIHATRRRESTAVIGRERVVVVGRATAASDPLCQPSAKAAAMEGLLQPTAKIPAGRRISRHHDPSDDGALQTRYARQTREQVAAPRPAVHIPAMPLLRPSPIGASAADPDQTLHVAGTFRPVEKTKTSRPWSIHIWNGWRVSPEAV